MISRFDKIAVDLPRPKNPSPNDAAAVQELLGGRFGEMSTLMNYTFQSFNFRGRSKLRPFYDLIANIAAEEYSHIETVSYAINLMLTGTDETRQRPVGDAARKRDRRAQLIPFYRQRSDGSANRFDGQTVVGRQCFFERQSQTRFAAQLLFGMRRARQQNARL